jgi:RNA-directed DNA polymerase
MASQEDSTGGATPDQGKAVQARAEVGGVCSSDEAAPDLWWFFDTIPHRKLLRLVARRVSDGAILKLIKAWLRAPILERRTGGGQTLKTNACGTPQGGVISPLLANIYLHPLDEAVNEQSRGRSGYKPTMVRYADDLVILCEPGDGRDLQERLARWLQSRGLTLNEKKTRTILSRESGFEFLGFSFRWQRSSKGTQYVHTEPSPAAEQSLRDKLRELTKRSTTWRPTPAVVREVNQVTCGWSNYFALAHYHRSFRQMNRFVAHRLRQWLWRKHGSHIGKYERWPDQALFSTYGLHHLRSPSPWAPAC